MKRTEIDYIELIGNRIKIVQFRNVATAKEIKEEFGERVSAAYTQGFPRYLNVQNDFVSIKIKQHWFQLKSGDVYTKDFFELVVRTMKKAGERLGYLKNVKTVVI